jgi:hypothetical protein
MEHTEAAKEGVKKRKTFYKIATVATMAAGGYLLVR